MNGDQRSGQQLLCDDEMAEISTGEGAAGIAIAGFIHGTLVAGIGGIHQVKPPLRAKAE